MFSQNSSVSEDRRAEIEKKIHQRIALEKKAFELVKHLALTEAVTEEELVSIGQNITREQYSDVTEERSIEKLCGYPLCSKPLENIVKQKYKISLINKTVYDLTERKKFCSNRCYEASKHFQGQISESPVWMRETETPVKFTILHQDENQKVFPRGRNGEIVFSSPWSNVSEALKSLKLNGEEASCELETLANIKLGHGERLELEEDELLPGRTSEESLVDVGQLKSCVSPNVATSASAVDERESRTESTTDSSLTPKSLAIFETVDDERKSNAKALTSDCDRLKYVDAKYKDKVTRSTTAGQQNVSLIEKLQFICEWKSRRTVKFFHSTASQDLSDYGQRVLQFYNVNSEIEENSNSEACLVPVDHLSQSFQRRRIVLEKLSQVWPKLEMLLQLSLGLCDCTDDLKELIYTFDFSNKNILFKPKEWILVGYILLKILDEKKKCLYGRKLNLDAFCITEEQVAKIVGFVTAYDDMEMVD